MAKKKVGDYSGLMYAGLFLVFPILFFGNQLRGNGERCNGVIV